MRNGKKQYCNISVGNATKHNLILSVLSLQSADTAYHKRTKEEPQQKLQGGNSQNFLRKFLIFFVTLGLQILRLQ